MCIRDRFFNKIPPPEKSVLLAQEYIDNNLFESNIFDRRMLVGVAGTFTSIASIFLKQTHFNEKEIHLTELKNEEVKDRDQLLERVAYTWFNRLCAFRYLDAKGWHPFGCKVLMAEEKSETQPHLLKLIRSRNLPLEIKKETDVNRLNLILDGKITTSVKGGDSQVEVYRELVLAACRLSLIHI